MMWFTADNHFFHSNIIKFTGRPFKGLKDMHETMIRRWNEKVAYDDTVFVLGDFCFGGNALANKMLKQLNGYKILIRGNHDKSKAKVFSAVIESCLISIAGQRVLLSHYPYLGDVKAEHKTDIRYIEKRPPDLGLWLIHGHVHEKWKIKGRMINVGVDVWDFAPVSKRTLEGIILKGEHKYAKTEKV